MAFERIMGIEVTNDELYQQYRKGMKPILATFGGQFIFDFKISEVLLSTSDNPINRLFTLRFPSEQHMSDFFNDAQYQRVQKMYFVPSVNSKTVISLHEVIP